MQLDATLARAGEEGETLAETIYAIGQVLAALEPGPLAELRRRPSVNGDAGAPYLWRLIARHGIRSREATWARIIRIMAILTEKGRDENKPSPHQRAQKANGWRGLGTALCDGGDRNWPERGTTPRPVYSEDRLARLLAAKRDTRADLMERAARMLAAKKPKGAPIDCTDIAEFLLCEDDRPARDIARDYYKRLDQALAQPENEEANSEMTGDDE
jgi:CRISPR system Cascade subunit CasB